MRGHIRKKGTSWQACVKTTDPVTGKARQLTAQRKTKREAESELIRLLAIAGRTDAAASSATMADLFGAWQSMHAARWSPSTVRNTRQFIERYLDDRFGRVLVRRLRRSDIDMFYGDLQRAGGHNGKALSPATVHRVHRVLHAALEQAVRWEWITDNPATNSTLPRLTADELKPPELADVVKLMAGAHALDPDFGVFIHLAATTGARRGELCALRWGDVDLDAGTLTIERSMAIGDTLVEKTTKTRNKRAIAMEPVDVDLLRAHRVRAMERRLAAGAPFDANAFLFSGDLGVSSWRPESMTHRFIALRRKLKIDTVRLHDLRHFNASTMLAAGVDLATVAGRLGHAGGGRTTLAVYGHLTRNADQRAASAIGDALRGAGQA